MRKIYCLILILLVACASGGNKVEVRLSSANGFRYIDALTAFHDGAYDSAAKQLRACISEEDREDDLAAMMASGMRKPYVPHYWLGRALAAMGDCEGARREFAESERQGVATRRSEYLNIIRINDGCGAK